MVLLSVEMMAWRRRFETLLYGQAPLLLDLISCADVLADLPGDVDTTLCNQHLDLPLLRIER